MAWIAKWDHYAGGYVLISRHPTRDEAQQVADEWNERYGVDRGSVEEVEMTPESL